MKPSSGSLSLSSTATGGRVEITCKFHPSIEDKDLITINMNRTLDGDTGGEQKLAGTRTKRTFDHSGDEVKGSEVNGSIEQRFLTFTMPLATCQDAGMYICYTQYYDGTKVFTSENSQNLTVTVDPGQATMGATPKLTVYSYNTFLSLTCSGAVGTVDDTTKVQWIWEYKESQGTSWYQVHDEEVTLKSSTPSGPGDCARYQVSKFDRALITEDTGKTFRCFVRRNGSTIQDFHQYAGTYTINTVLKPGMTTTTAANTRNVQNGGMRVDTSSSYTVTTSLTAALMFLHSLSAS
ncbi:hypothetical protein BaRGS_00019850 [Batillaria attramentaria]|uniref:Immunoglobulin V-set domain-containing protein n=1 Tax=Batillaria attramentaria TaxID=370345 RepID=A0ABD0KPQ4_9CAEN